MASFFRASCAVYWLVWLIVLSYAIGISIYEIEYVIEKNEQYNKTTALVKTLCFICAAYSFLGCIFVKCDISHLGCFLLYVVPLLFVIPGLSIYGIVTNFPNKKDNGSSLVNSTILLKTVKNYWQKNSSSPGWLTRTEVNKECCGLFSYKDYQLIFYSTIEMINSTSGDGQVPKEFPISCCNSYHGKVVVNDGVPLAGGEKQDSTQTHCILELGRISTTRGAANLSATYVEYDWENKVYNKSVGGPDFPIFFDEDKRSMVHTNGCLTVIMQQHMSAVEAHEAFFVILIIASVFMLMVYVKSWCDGRHFSGSGSEHSLDVENMSVIDIPRLSQGSGGGGDRPTSGGVVASGVRRMSAEARRMSDGLTTGIVGIARNSFSLGGGNPAFS